MNQNQKKVLVAGAVAVSVVAVTFGVVANNSAVHAAAASTLNQFAQKHATVKYTGTITAISEDKTVIRISSDGQTIQVVVGAGYLQNDVNLNVGDTVQVTGLQMPTGFTGDLSQVQATELTDNNTVISLHPKQTQTSYNGVTVSAISNNKSAFRFMTSDGKLVDVNVSKNFVTKYIKVGTVLNVSGFQIAAPFSDSASQLMPVNIAIGDKTYAESDFGRGGGKLRKGGNPTSEPIMGQ